MDGVRYLPHYIDTAKRFISELEKYKIHDIDDFIRFVEHNYNEMERFLFSALSNGEITMDDYEKITTKIDESRKTYMKKVGDLLNHKVS